MILDTLISLVAAVITSVIETISLLIALLFELIVFSIELVLRLFVRDFRFKRRGSQQWDRNRLTRIWATVAVVGFICLLGLVHLMRERHVTLKAKDGNELPFAGVIIETRDGKQVKRTDVKGNVSFPRWNVVSIAVDDPRYEKIKWDRSQIQSELFVERTLLGSSLDVLTDNFADKLNRKD